MGIHVLKSARYMGKSSAWWCSSQSTDKLCDNFERSKGDVTGCERFKKAAGECVITT